MSKVVSGRPHRGASRGAIVALLCTRAPFTRYSRLWVPLGALCSAKAVVDHICTMQYAVHAGWMINVQGGQSTFHWGEPYYSGYGCTNVTCALVYYPIWKLYIIHWWLCSCPSSLYGAIRWWSVGYIVAIHADAHICVSAHSMTISTIQCNSVGGRTASRHIVRFTPWLHHNIRHKTKYNTHHVRHNIIPKEPKDPITT